MEAKIIYDALKFTIPGISVKWIEGILKAKKSIIVKEADIIVCIVLKDACTIYVAYTNNASTTVKKEVVRQIKASKPVEGYAVVGNSSFVRKHTINGKYV